MYFFEDGLRETQPNVSSTTMHVVQLKLGQCEQLQPSLVKLYAGYENYLIKFMCRLAKLPHHCHLAKSDHNILLRKNTRISEMLSKEKYVHLQIHELRISKVSLCPGPPI